MIEFIKPNLSHIKAMQNLVEDEVANGIILPRSDDEVATNIRSYLIGVENGEVIAYAALHIHSPNLAEIRSIVVSKNHRGKGIGSKIVENLLKEASNLQIKKVFTLTFRQSFFENLGFIVIPKTQLPEQKIWADCVKCKHFPICNEIALIYKV
nr:N-acetyltransferase [Campylobacter sp.]